MKCECKFICYFRNYINGRVRMFYNKKKFMEYGFIF